MRIVLFALFLVLFMPLTAHAKKGAVVGVFAATEGKVTVAGRKAKEGDSFAMGDMIETQKGSNALLTFIDGTDFSLGENAKFKIDDYVYDPDNSSGNKARFSVLRGAFVFTSGLISKVKKPDVKIKTGYGSIGIRGTKFWGGNVKDEYGVYVEEGRVDFSNNAGSRKLSKGQGTTVSGMNAMPAEVQQWGQELLGLAFGQTDFLDPATMALKLANAESLNAQHLEQYLKQFIEKELKNELENKMKQNLPIPGGFKLP